MIDGGFPIKRVFGGKIFLFVCFVFLLLFFDSLYVPVETDGFFCRVAFVCRVTMRFCRRGECLNPTLGVLEVVVGTAQDAEEVSAPDAVEAIEAAEVK